MKKSIFISALLLLGLSEFSSQDRMTEVLSIISSNNLNLKANAQYFEAKKWEYQTGLLPDNPFVTYDFMVGSPQEAGNQTDFSVVQSFDFPSSYRKKKEISEQLISQTDILFDAQRKDILLKSKKICLELTYRSKVKTFLLNRRLETESLLSDFEKKMELGDAHILDINKAKLMLLKINKEHLLNLSYITQLEQKLIELNGGVDIEYTESDFSSENSIPHYDQLFIEIKSLDPLNKYLISEMEIAENQITLSKILNLPKMEIGYHYQEVLNQTFNGFRLGLSIPLWEGKNKVKMQESMLLFKHSDIEVHHAEHLSDLKNIYEQHSALQDILQEYEAAFATINNHSILNLAIEHGQISTLEYFMEMNFYNEAYLSYLDTEFKYQISLSELLKHRL